MNITIKSLLDYELEDVVAAWNEAFSDYVVDVSQTVESFTNMLDSQKMSWKHSLVAEVDGVPSGVLITAHGKYPFEGETKNIGWVGGLAVVPKYRKYYLGTMLMEKNDENMKAEGVELVTLEVVKANKIAVNLYRGLGFKDNKEVIVGTLEEKNLPEAHSHITFNRFNGMDKEVGEEIIAWKNRHFMEGQYIVVYANNFCIGEIYLNVSNGAIEIKQADFRTNDPIKIQQTYRELCKIYHVEKIIFTNIDVKLPAITAVEEYLNDAPIIQYVLYKAL